MIFSSSNEDINHFDAKQPLPFRTIGDPELKLYQQYGVEHSSKAFLKALLFKLPHLAYGLAKGGRTKLRAPSGNLVPADFLIGPNGKVVDAWYGRDAADHIPMKRLNRFAVKVKSARERKAQRQRARATELLKERADRIRQKDIEFSEQISIIEKSLLQVSLTESKYASLSKQFHEAANKILAEKATQ